MIEMIEMPENSNKEKKGQRVLLNDLPFFCLGLRKKKQTAAKEEARLKLPSCSCVDFHLHPPPSGADCLHKHKPRMERMAAIICQTVTPLNEPRRPKSGVQFQLPHMRMAREIRHLSEKAE